MGQIDYDILLEKGKLEAARVMCFSGANEEETFGITVDGSMYSSYGKFVDNEFCMLNGDGEFITASAEVFRKDIDRLITQDNLSEDDLKLANYLINCLMQYDESN
jgi:hypothetical protein